MEDTELLNLVVDILVHEPNGKKIGFGGSTQHGDEARIDLNDGRSIYVCVLHEHDSWPQ